jgi:hypothetical protein
VDEGTLLLAEAIRHAAPLPPRTDRPRVLADAAADLPEPLLVALAEASSGLFAESRMSLLGRIALLLPPGQRSGILGEAETLYLDHFEHLDPAHRISGLLLCELADLDALSPDPRIQKALAAAAARMDRELNHRYDEDVLLRVARCLPLDERDAIRAEVRERLRLPQDFRYVLESCPAEVCDLLKPEGAVELLERVRAFDTDYHAPHSAAALAPFLPPTLRGAVVARMVAEHEAGGDPEHTLPWVLHSVRWMTTGDRAQVFCEASTRTWSRHLFNVLHTPGGWLPARAELIRLLGGEAAVLGAARAIVETAGWVG